MSSPFPLEEQAQTSHEGMWDPWKGPTPSSFGGDVVRSPYTILEGLGSGAAKGQAVLAGLLHTSMSPDIAQMTSEGLSPEAIASARKQADEMQQHGADAFAADARERVKALTPDAATTGTATQVLHGVTSAAEQMIVGSLVAGPAGGAAAVGSGEGLSRFQELREQGVTPGTAGASAALTGVTSAAGALVPAAYGSTLATRLLTGMAGNTAFGVVNRGADHLILAANGYTQMAEQAKVWDSTQMLVDVALGATFGGVHHAMSPAEERTVTALKQNTDAALTANLALKDRGSAPGVAVDPTSAQAHQAALQKALTDVVQGKPVDVADTGIERAEFLKRPAPDDTPAMQLMADALKESGFLDEEANLRDLEEQFAQRMGERPESVKPAPTEEPNAYSVREEALTDEQRQTFQGLRSDVQTDQELGGSGEREPGQSGPEHDGGPGKEPLTVYRGASHELAPEHFDLESLGKATGHPSSGLGVFFTNTEEEAARYGAVSAHNLDIRNPKLIPADELPGFDTLEDAHAFREKLRVQGYDGITIDASHLGGPVHHVAFEPHQVIPAKPSVVGDPIAQALAERPNLEITGDHGKPVKAADALEAAQPETDWFTATKAATDCFSRRGS